MKIFSYLMVMSTLICAYANAQLLPNNNQLSVVSVQRWMDSNRDLSPVVEMVDGMHATEEDLKKFDLLSPVEQDQKISAFLQQKKIAETATSIAVRHGWKSVGEYMRLSTKLGNAIAAYFLAGEIEKLSAEHKKQVLDKADPAVIAVPAADLAFVKANEKLLQEYIMAYGSGR